MGSTGKVGEVVGGMGEFKRTSGGRTEVLFRLTEALCELSCVETPADRVRFADVLGRQLGIAVSLRGGRRRDDVISLVRAAQSVSDGERALLTVVRILEGAVAADAIEQELASLYGANAPALELSGPVSQRDVRAAVVLLGQVADWLSGAELRDRLAQELRIDFPSDLSPVQLFEYVMEFNVQPDGLPPAVLLMDQAAASVRIPGRRASLSGWAEDWASRAGLLTRLEERRAARARVRTDPTIPTCLVVVVEPARDGSGDVVVRPWLNTVPGRWAPLPAEPVTTTLEDLGVAIDEVLRQLARLSPPADGPTSTVSAAPPCVEFVLPYDLLNHDVAGLNHRSGDSGSLPLGLKYGVHLRSLERMRTDDTSLRRRWRERWSVLRTHGIAVHGWRDADEQRPDEWQAALVAEPRITAAVLDAPVGGPAMAALKEAIAAGIGLAVWDRRGEFLEERREVVSAVFASVPTPAQLPLAVHRLRSRAAVDQTLLGRHIAFFWDDPTRLVDVQEDDPDIDVDHRQ
ncbi:effector-associated domain 2-containing protein [Streptomyces sp. 303MFCol5.2]|uniref:VMAP-C domain-containing protein n=1 Tax=Streptomyces sp. 303MFCol5.2 TaxID=1172181 RepID=UPI000366B57E|nr:hypothetical protein [Streptomyces sp. 303MFCol5.2]